MVNAIIDLHGPEGVGSWAKVKAAGIEAIIHKATEGQDFVDAKYADRRAATRKAGFLWGSYHFGTAADPKKQAENFLKVVKPTDKDLIVLDFEDNEHKPSNTMKLSQAEAFVTHIHAETGRFPGLYGSHAQLTEKLKGHPDSVLKNCWLWLAAWKKDPKPVAVWKEFKIWQYTDGITGPDDLPKTVPTIGVCDRSQFNGTEAEMREFFGAD